MALWSFSQLLLFFNVSTSQYSEIVLRFSARPNLAEVTSFKKVQLGLFIPSVPSQTSLYLARQSYCGVIKMPKLPSPARSYSDVRAELEWLSV